MIERVQVRRAATAAALLVLAVLPVRAHAETIAGNDEVAGATPISTLPFNFRQDVTGATASPTDPAQCWNGFTVWYSLTAPVGGVIRVQASGPFRTVPGGAAVFAGTPEDLVPLGCGQEGAIVDPQWVDASVTAGQTLYIMTGASGQPVSDTTDPGYPTTILLDVRYLSPKPTIIGFSVDPVGTVTKSGRVTVTGTIRCDIPAAESYVTVNMTQTWKRATASGSGANSVTCDNSRRYWSVQVSSATAIRFGTGQAAVESLATAGGDQGGSEAGANATVKLRSTK